MIPIKSNLNEAVLRSYGFDYEQHAKGTHKFLSLDLGEDEAVYFYSNPQLGCESVQVLTLSDEDNVMTIHTREDLERVYELITGGKIAQKKPTDLERLLRGDKCSIEGHEIIKVCDMRAYNLEGIFDIVLILKVEGDVSVDYLNSHNVCGDFKFE